MMKKILVTVLLLITFNVTAFAGENRAIDFLSDAGIVRGSGSDVLSEDYITYGEFATILGRIYKGADKYEKSLSWAGEHFETFCKTYRGIKSDEEALNLAAVGDVWKEYTVSVCIDIFSTEEMVNTIDEKFYEKISPDFAAEMLRMMFISYYVVYYQGKYMIPNIPLSAFGYDMSLIPDGEYVTRDQAAEMAAGILYIAVSRPAGCWYPEPAWSLFQYTLDGPKYLLDGGSFYADKGIGVAIELAKKAPKASKGTSWQEPVDYRHIDFFRENISLKQNREQVINIVGEPYEAKEDVDIYVIHDGTTHGFAKIEYRENKVFQISYDI